LKIIERTRSKVKRGQMYQILNTWHPVNGKMVHILQLYHSGVTKYYTDGELIKEEKVEYAPFWAQKLNEGCRCGKCHKD